MSIREQSATVGYVTRFTVEVASTY